MITANDHARDIEALWQRQISGDEARMDMLAAHLAATAGTAPSGGGRTRSTPEP